MNKETEKAARLYANKEYGDRDNMLSDSLIDKWESAYEGFKKGFEWSNIPSADLLQFTNWYSSKDMPPIDTNEEDLTDYVLIDRNGFRDQDDFEIGYYNTSLETWCLKHSDKKIDFDHMKWTHLPIDKEKK